MPVVFRVKENLFFFLYLFKEACPPAPYLQWLFFIVAIKWKMILAVFVICFLYISYNSVPKLMVNMFLIVRLQFYFLILF